MATTSDISRGMILKLEGSLYSVVEFGENNGCAGGQCGRFMNMLNVCFQGEYGLVNQACPCPCVSNNPACSYWSESKQWVNCDCPSSVKKRGK